MMRWLAVWPLLLLPAAAWFLGSEKAPVWRIGREFFLLVGSGLAFLLLSSLWFWRYVLTGGGLHPEGFSDLCLGLGGHGDLPLLGRLLRGLVPVLGIQSTLLWGAALSQGILGASLYVGGRAIRGPVTGGIAVLVALSMSPLVVLGRSMSLLPETVALVALSGAGVAVAGRRASLGLGIASGLVGLLALAGGVGQATPEVLPWALPAGVALLVVLLRGDGRDLGLALWPLLLAGVAAGLGKGSTALLLVGLPGLLGLALAAPGVRGLGMLGALALLVFGVLPSGLSPVASWRTPLTGTEDLSRGQSEACVALLQAESVAGLQPYGPARKKPRSFLTQDQVFAAALARFDQNGDGSLSGAEYQIYGDASEFAATDANADGTVSGEEFRTWLLYTQPRPQDRPFVSALHYLESTPESRAASMGQRPAPPPAAPGRPSPPSNKKSPLPWIGAGLALAAVLLGGFFGWRRR